MTYEIEIPSRTQPLQIFHVNMLKKWYARSTQPDPTSVGITETATALFVRSMEGEEEIEEQYLPGHQGNSSLILEHLEDGQRQELLQCLPTQLFMETLGRTDVIHHHITLKYPNPIRQPVYRVPERLLPVMKEELEIMQSLGVIEPSTSEWSNPIVVVPKKDGSLRFCLDFCKINSVSKFDPYPMPRVD